MSNVIAFSHFLANFSPGLNLEESFSIVAQFWGQKDVCFIQIHVKGAFNNLWDKKGWIGGLKFASFVHVYLIKNVHGG